jgi:hypothetical protein
LEKRKCRGQKVSIDEYIILSNCANIAIEIRSIYDYEKGMEVKFTQSMMEEARTTLGAWMGSIEDGPQTALHVLRNRVCDFDSPWY